MGLDGELKNADGSPVINNQYRYRDQDSRQLEKTIEQKKAELKELEERKKEQLLEKNNAQRDSAKKERLDDPDKEDWEIKGSPVFSLVQLIL